MLREVLQDPKLTLEFSFKDFEFRLEREGTPIPFDNLPDGYSSILALWTDILLRAEAIEGEPHGWVLIDEPEPFDQLGFIGRVQALAQCRLKSNIIDHGQGRNQVELLKYQADLGTAQFCKLGLRCRVDGFSG